MENCAEQQREELHWNGGTLDLSEFWNGIYKCCCRYLDDLFCVLLYVVCVFLFIWLYFCYAWSWNSISRARSRSILRLRLISSRHFDSLTEWMGFGWGWAAGAKRTLMLSIVQWSCLLPKFIAIIVCAKMFLEMQRKYMLWTSSDTALDLLLFNSIRYGTVRSCTAVSRNAVQQNTHI